MATLIHQGIRNILLSPLVVVVALTGWWASIEVFGQELENARQQVIIDDREPQGEFDLDHQHMGSLDFLHEDDPFQPNVGKITFSGGVDFTNAYFFRGLLQEDQGLIAQPWAEATFDLYDGEGVLNDLTFTMGIWNSIHDNNTNETLLVTDDGDLFLFHDDTLDVWYESDLYVTVSAGIAENWGLGFTYVVYTSPASTFTTIHEIMVTLTYDDSLFWEERGYKAPGFSGLQPTITFGFELDGAADGQSKGIYFEFQVEPSFTSFIEFGGSPVSFSIPVTVGISLDDYYEDVQGEDHTFGFFDVGIVGAWPISFIPLDYGTWQLAAGGHFLFMADTTHEINNGDDFEVIGTISISLGY